VVLKYVTDCNQKETAVCESNLLQLFKETTEMSLQVIGQNVCEPWLNLLKSLFFIFKGCLQDNT